MKLESIIELKNPRVSYQILLTFDLVGAEPSKYNDLRDTLASNLEFEKYVHLSGEDGGGVRPLPYNTLAALWTKDSTEQATRDHFATILKKSFKEHGLKGTYIILVAQNWAVAAGEI